MRARSYHKLILVFHCTFFVPPTFLVIHALVYLCEMQEIAPYSEIYDGVHGNAIILTFLLLGCSIPYANFGLTSKTYRFSLRFKFSCLSKSFTGVDRNLLYLRRCLYVI